MNGDILAMGPEWGVQRYTSDGTFIDSWPGEGEAFKNLPGRIAIDAARGTVYTLGLREFGIQAYDRNGHLLNRIGDIPSRAPGQFYWPSRIAVASDGSVFVQDGFRIQRFSKQGTFLNDWAIPTGYIYLGYPMSATANGSILVYLDRTNRMQKYSLSGHLIGEWTWNDHFPTSSEMDVDEFGRVWIPDSYRSRVTALSVQGKVLKSWGSSGSTPGTLQRPIAIAAKEGVVVVYDQNGLQVFDENGNFLKGLSGVEPWGFSRLSIVDRKLYATNPFGDVSVFDLNGIRLGLGGELLHTFTHAGPATVGQLPPRDVAASPDGDVYVLSPRTGQVFHYYFQSTQPSNPTRPEP